jgi:uncharacterized membrane protein
MQLQPSSATLGAPYRTPQAAVIVHLATVLPAVLLGALVLAKRKGDPLHRLLGGVWMTMMVVTAIASFWIRGQSGGLSGIHLFSVGTLIAVPVSLWRIRAGDVRTHRGILTSLYIGLLVAGAFTLAPDRLAGRFLLELSGTAAIQEVPVFSADGAGGSPL